MFFCCLAFVNDKECKWIALKNQFHNRKVSHLKKKRLVIHSKGIDWHNSDIDWIPTILLILHYSYRNLNWFTQNICFFKYIGFFVTINSKIFLFLNCEPWKKTQPTITSILPSKKNWQNNIIHWRDLNSSFEISMSLTHLLQICADQ